MRETLDYWNKRASESMDVESVTHADVFQRKFEIDTLLKNLDSSDTLLDMGCGNGYSTNYFSGLCKEVVGGDFSEKMIERAKSENAKDNVSYVQIDARNFNLEKKFSKIITQRCLINILDWEGQKSAIKNIHAHLETGGELLMMEGLEDGRNNLNKARVEMGLDELTPVQYNYDFKLDRTKEYCSDLFDLVNIVTFGDYEMITRIVYPKMIFPEEPTYGSKFHEVACELILN